VTDAVARQRRAGHPAVTSLAVSIVIAIATTAMGAPGNSTVARGRSSVTPSPCRPDRRQAEVRRMIAAVCGEGKPK
jgi:hypothetical protein